MGFFNIIGDAVGSAVGTVKNVVSHSIVKPLVPLISMVANAVPVIGPVVDNAVIVVDTIFSKDGSISEAPATEKGENKNSGSSGVEHLAA